MRLCIYAHPFDLEALSAHGGLARLRDLGFAEVALAVSYHDGRWLTPWHPTTRVRFLEDGTVHFRPSSRYGVLQPLASSSVPARGPSPLERLATEARAVGLQVRAWTVFTHNSRLGELHAGLCVQNAFGDVHRYALCPVQADVQQWIEALVRDLAAHDGLHALELEALGPMGWKHSSHHDKASFAPSGLLDAALSTCFCSACCSAMQLLGHDAALLAEQVRAFVRRHVDDACAMQPAKVPAGPADLGAEGAPAWLEAALAVRRSCATALATLVHAHAGSCRVAVQVHPHPWFTGSQLAAATAAAFPVGDERVLTCYGDGPDAIARLLAHDGMQAAAGAPIRVCVWPKAPQFAGDADLQKLRDVCLQRGVAALAVYHLGLLPWRTIERTAKMLRA